MKTEIIDQYHLWHLKHVEGDILLQTEIRVPDAHRQRLLDAVYVAYDLAMSIHFYRLETEMHELWLLKQIKASAYVFDGMSSHKRSKNLYDHMSRAFLGSDVYSVDRIKFRKLFSHSIVRSSTISRRHG